MALDLMGWFEQWVVPALVARLDVALPEFGWRRRGTYWQATARAHTEGLWGVRAEYVLAHDRTWWGVSVNDNQRFVPWLMLPLDGEVDGEGAGGDSEGGWSVGGFEERVRGLAARVQLEVPGDLEPLSPERWGWLRRMRLMESLIVGGVGVFGRAKLGRQFMQQRKGLDEDQVGALPLGLFYGPALLAHVQADGFDDVALRELGFFEVAERWPRRLLVPWRDVAGKLCTVAAVDVSAEMGGEGRRNQRGGERKEGEGRVEVWPQTEAPPLFGLDVTLRHPDGLQHLVIVEDLLDAVALHAHDLRRIVALGRSPWGVGEGLWSGLDALGVQEVTLATAPPEATLHALTQHRLSNAALSPYILVLKGDSGSLVRMVEAGGVEAVQKALTEQRQSAARYTLEAALGEIQPSDAPETRQQALIRWFKAATPALLDADTEALIALKLAQRQTGFDTTSIERLRHQCASDEPAPLPLLTIVGGQSAPVGGEDVLKQLREALDKTWADALATRIFLGMVSLPQTPTRTRALLQWLFSVPIREGLRVFWVSPSVAAQDQTARIALELAEVYGPQSLRVRIIDPVHGLTPDITATIQEDVLCLCTTATVIQHPAWALIAAEGRRCVTVLDEAQLLMSVAMRQWLAELKRPLPIRVLGVTSRPEQALDFEPHTTQNSFCGRVLYAESAAQQRSDHLLLPCTTRLITTEIAPESVASDDDLSFWARFHDMSPAWLSRLAALSDRDTPLLNALSQPPLPFKKLLILTLGTGHTLRLMDRLSSVGLSPAHLLPTHSDSRPLLRSPALRHFCDPGSNPDGAPALLLAPYNISPHALSTALHAADALVITHPCPSETWLRGVLGDFLDAQVREFVENQQTKAPQNLWLFQDRWTPSLEDAASAWRTLSDLLGEPTPILETAITATTENLTITKTPAELPWDIALHLRRCVESLGLPPDHSTLPEGWYELQTPNGERRCIPVHAQHRSAWQSLWRTLTPLKKQTLTESESTELAHSLLAIFSDLPPPTPSLVELLAVVTSPQPLYTPSPAHNTLAPSGVAAEVVSKDLSISQILSLTRARYDAHPLAPILYPTHEHYVQSVLQAISTAPASPSSATTPPQTAAPLRWNPSPPHAPYHDLPHLLEETLRRAAAFLKLPLAVTCPPHPALDSPAAARLARPRHALPKRVPTNSRRRPAGEPLARFPRHRTRHPPIPSLDPLPAPLVARSRRRDAGPPRIRLGRRSPRQRPAARPLSVACTRSAPLAQRKLNPSVPLVAHR